MTKKAKAKGRPKIPDTERASEWLPGIRVTSAELDQYHAAAQIAGLPLSQWARNALAAAVKKPQSVANKPQTIKPSKAQTEQPSSEPPHRLRRALEANAKSERIRTWLSLTQATHEKLPFSEQMDLPRIYRDIPTKK